MAGMNFVSRAALIVNSHSRVGRKMFNDACAALKALRIGVDAYAVNDPGRLHAIARTALAKQPDILILGGGDGTISSLVDHIVGSDIPLGLLPLGTANSFARTLGIPFDLDEAINIIAAGHRRRIDLGMIDDDYFANSAAIGMSPLIAKTIPHQLKRFGGRAGYALWAAVQSARFEPFRVTVTVDGGARAILSALEVRIANGRYHGGTRVVEQAKVDSGEIVVQVVEGETHGRLALNWLATLAGSDLRHQLTREFRGRAIRIETNPPLPISIDGEVLARTPVTAKVAPHAIEVFAPRER
jgi:YegS/Rv2252/BmrU family lipid kinase